MTHLIIDANNLAWRAQHTTGGLSYKGQPTGVIYGFLMQLYHIAADLQPEALTFCWDSRKSHRRRRYPFYKQRRRDERGDEQEFLEAVSQFKLLREELLPEIGFRNNFLATGYEADDLIAAIVKSREESFVVCSSDNDLLQLLNHCVIYKPGKNIVYDKKKFVEAYGIDPKQWADVKALAGCTGDGVPGVHGIGEKTAAAFLRGSLSQTSKKYALISSTDPEIIKRNDWLVRLPLPGLRLEKIEPQKCRFNQVAFDRICNRLGFYKMPNKTEWHVHFFHVR